MKNILSAVFVIGFVLTGCGIDSIFNGGAVVWSVIAATTAICGYFVVKGECYGEGAGDYQH